MKLTPHSPGKLKCLPWPVCSGCGLIYLRNELTAWCVTKGCDHDLLPEYPRVVRELTRERRAE